MVGTPGKPGVLTCLELMKVLVHGYKMYGARDAPFVRINKPLHPILRMLGINSTITHLSIQVGDVVGHAFSDQEVRWCSTAVDKRVFTERCISIYVGETRMKESEVMSHFSTYDSNAWGLYLWLYSGGLYKGKRDCVTFVQDVLKKTRNLHLPYAGFPSCLLKELENRGYRSS